jgi:tetratricopeptide (TPR) repeat protein
MVNALILITVLILISIFGKSWISNKRYMKTLLEKNFLNKTVYHGNECFNIPQDFFEKANKNFSELLKIKALPPEKASEIKSLKKEWTEKFQETLIYVDKIINEVQYYKTGFFEKIYSFIYNGEFDTAKNFIRESLTKYPDNRSEKFFLMGKILLLMMEPIKALEFIKKAVKTEPQNFYYAHEYALLLYNQNQYTHSKKICENNLKILRELKTKTPEVYEPKLSHALSNLASIKYNMIELEEAEKLFNESLEMYQTLSEKNPLAYKHYLAWIYNNYGNILIWSEEYGKAKNYCKEAVSLYREIESQNPLFSPYLADSLNNLGNFYVFIEEFDKAEKCFKESIEKYKKLNDKNIHVYEPCIADILTDIASMNIDRKKYNEAENYYFQAFEIYNKYSELNPECKIATAQILEYLGALKREIDDLEKAEEYYKAALENYRECSLENQSISNFYIPEALNNLGNVQKDLKKYAEAEESYRECLKMYENSGKTLPGLNVEKIEIIKVKLKKVQEIRKVFAQAQFESI